MESSRALYGAELHITTWGASDVGRVREVNEDCYIVAPDLGLLAVADGMGGHHRGDVASQLACNVLKEAISGHGAVIQMMERNPSDSSRVAVEAMLENAVQRASSEVFEASEAIAGQGKRMGTTIDVLLVVAHTAFLAHVGDGRVYLLRDGEVHQLTRDHSVVEQQLSRGELTPEEARRSQKKNLITRALGVFDQVQVDMMNFDLLDDDKLLLCSDGLHRYLGPSELGEALLKRMDPDVPGRLIGLANRRGGRDNSTAVCVQFQAESTAEMQMPTRQCLEALRKVPLLQFCTYRELIMIHEVARFRSLGPNELLFYEGQVGRSAMVVINGTVALERKGQTLAVAESGGCIGEISLVRSMPRSCDARTLEDTELLVIDRDRFLQILKQDTELGSKLSWYLLKRMSRLVGEGVPPVLPETLAPVLRG
jgi:serine/threonine protein phosphatase PrpC